MVRSFDHFCPEVQKGPLLTSFTPLSGPLSPLSQGYLSLGRGFAKNRQDPLWCLLRRLLPSSQLCPSRGGLKAILVPKVKKRKSFTPLLPLLRRSSDNPGPILDVQRHLAARSDKRCLFTLFHAAICDFLDHLLSGMPGPRA